MKEKQLLILQCIYNNVQDKGYPPTVREICNAVGITSTSTVHSHLTQLERDGYLFKDSTKPRALEITDKGLDMLGVKPSLGIPILGTVPAGEPVLAVEDIEGYFPTPPMFSDNDENLFMLQISGESMIEAGILDGDYVIVRQQATAENGQIVIAMTEDGEATCKRFYKESNYFRLQPENSTMAPILLNQVTILGKVVSLYREHLL